MRVVVIGAGIVGASTAYHVARRGVPRGDVEVVLVDRGDAGRATDAGAGIVCPWISPRADTRSPAYQLDVRGACYYPQLVARLADDGEAQSSYAPVGAMFVSADPDQLADFHERVTARAAQTPAVGTVTRLEPHEVRQLFPPLRADLDGVHVSCGGRVDGRAIRNALVSAGARLGVRRTTGAARLVLDGGRVTGVAVAPDGAGDAEVIGADAVVVAAGAWSDAILAPTGVYVGVEPQKGQIVHLHTPNTDTSAWPVVQPGGSHYLLAFPGGRVVVGATRETGSGYDVRITPAGLRQVLSDALSVAPGLAHETVLETRVGLRPLSHDGLPTVGRLPHLDAVVVATGLGATGLTAGPYVGALAANLALGDDADVLDDTPFGRPQAEPFEPATVGPGPFGTGPLDAASFDSASFDLTPFRPGRHG